jgi:PAS domain S-box-containing protein
MRSRIPGKSLLRAKVRSLRQRVQDLERGLRLRDQLLQVLSEGAFLIDPTLPDCPIIYANPSFERLTGYAAGDVVGRGWRFLEGPETNKAEATTLREAAQRGRDGVAELVWHRKSGAPFWGALRLHPVCDREGRVTHLVGVLSDGEEHHRLEEQLRQAQRLATLGRLAAGVAHDFNNLLTAILGYSGLLLTGRCGPEQFREGLVEIHRAGERAASLTHQILGFTRKRGVRPQFLDLNEIVADVEKLLRRLIGDDVDLVSVLGPALEKVNSDRGQIEQVLLNLVANARDAMPRGGRLTIRTADVRFAAGSGRGDADVPAGSYALLAVSDQGCGMDARTRARLFEPFFTTKEAGKGTGLGLATVYAIVRQANGHIRVDSELGRGTTFKVYLPHAPVGEAPKPRKSAGSPELPRGAETVLLVEDHSSTRALIRSVLQRAGYEVLEARDGEEAVEVGENHGGPVHLLVTDVVLPRISGPQVAAQLSLRWPALRTLYTSGYTEHALNLQGARKAGLAFLPKPFTVQGLACAVRNVLDDPAQAEPVGFEGRAKTVLLIEDDLATREALAAALQDQGYAVASAPNGQEALARLREGQLPSVILLDLMMPVMDGWQFRAEQRRDARLAPVPVVIVTASGDVCQKAAALGAAGYLQKPVEMDELIAHVQRHCAFQAGPGLNPQLGPSPGDALPPSQA